MSSFNPHKGMPAAMLKYRLQVLDYNGYHLVYPHGITFSDVKEYLSGSLKEPLYQGCTFRVLFNAAKIGNETEIKIARDSVDSSEWFVRIYVNDKGKVLVSGHDTEGAFNSDFGVPDVKKGDFYTLGIRFEAPKSYRGKEFFLDAFALDIGSFCIFELKYTGTDGMLMVSFSVPSGTDKFTAFRKTPLKDGDDFLVYIRSAPTGMARADQFPGRRCARNSPWRSPKHLAEVFCGLYQANVRGKWRRTQLTTHISDLSSLRLDHPCTAMPPICPRSTP
ncbi:hypothetical protein MRX96_055279 [Rhipicephalus microplus]